ncbi:MAG: speE 2 [Gammaproteobacteria bacterium]|jgi:predicted membrane-bound spermidine synthase|nr:speE 2 [Gammaproteobacteria bacterium]
MPIILSPTRILTIILLEGFVTISLEILTIRQLIPVVGNSVIVTSLIIGIFLLCLAYGYRAGGLQNSDLIERLQRNFLWCALGIGIGLSYLFITYFFSFSHDKLGIPLLVSLLSYLLLVTAPIIYLLGQTVPITMSLLHQQESAGKLAGKVLHLSTLGSFLGAVLTTLVVMNFLGVAWTVLANCGVLALLFLLLYDYKQSAFGMGLLIISLGLSYIINRGMEQQLFIATTPYANYLVIADTQLESEQKGKLLSVNGSASSFIGAQKQGFPYIERIKAILFHELELKDKNILVLGAGGFSLSAAGTFDNHFTYVDIDPAIYPLVKRYFVNPIQGNFIAADARQFVKLHPHRYDVIVSDAYSNTQSIPAHLLTHEHLINIKQALKPQGIAIFNLIANPLLNTPYAKRLDNTLRNVFSSCTVNPLQFTWQRPVNIIYVCQVNTEETDKTIYTDDRNRASTDYFVAK